MFQLPPQRTASLLHSTTSNTSSTREIPGLIAPELQNLTVHDVDVINAVIERAGPSATTFFAVFKAYSDVLKERGLDPQEVVYYGKLLKLGTLRGKNWGEKWEAVKLQMAQKRPISPSGTSQTESEVVAPLRTRPTEAIVLGNDTHRRERKPLDIPCRVLPEQKRRSSHSSEKRSEKAEGKRKSDIFHAKEDFLSSTLILKTKPRHLLSTDTSEEGDLSSPILPSYKSIIVEPTPPLPISSKSQRGGMTQPDSLFTRKKIITAPKERVKPAVNLDEAWKNIKMEQDEKFADEYRNHLLLSRCWDIWKQGYTWVMNTHEQVQGARNMLLLRLYLQKWQDRINARRDAENKLVARFSMRLLKRTLDIWTTKLKQKRLTVRREDMRNKMKVIKRKCDVRIKKDAWMKWQRVLLLHRAHRHYEIGLLCRSLTHWKWKSKRLISLEQNAGAFAKDTEFKLAHRYWTQWKRNAALQQKNLAVTRMVEARIMAASLNRWRSRMAQVQLAGMFRDQHTLSRAVSRWKAVQASKRILDRRVNKYIRQKDDLLLRAVIRIWRSRMRGAKLQRFREATVLQNAWQNWRYRFSKEGAQLDVANNFLNRTNSRLTAAAFQRWMEVLVTHRNATAYAISYDEAHLQARILRAWRMQLHNALQTRKVARWADRYFATRNAWKRWVTAVQERQRQRKLREFEVARLRDIFEVWKSRTKRVQYLAQCELLLCDRIEKRVMRNALTHWTNRVITIKLRELDVAQQADVALLRAAWLKWKNGRRRHIEEVSLLENYILVKREDILRRAFYRWLTVKRAAEHRRLAHKRKEALLRQTLITSAWERWRERFKEERLRPVEYQVIIDHQRYVLRHAFNMWKSKTDCLPAVRFHSKHVKEKFFKVWKDMMPNALKAKKARELDRQNTLACYLGKWMQAYKTKTTLKAVARAKYLGLPASSRQPVPALKPRSLFLGATLLPRRRSISSEDDDTQAEDADPVPFRRPALSRAPYIPMSRSSEKGETYSEYASSNTRQPSPVRSTASLPDRRSRSLIPSGKAASVVDSAVNNDRLWDTIRRVAQPRRPRNM